MNKYKQRLIILLLIQFILTLVHITLREPTAINENILASPWHFWLGLSFGVFVFIYALSLRCSIPTCHRMQVFRGLSIFDIKWPEDKCYSCGTHLTSENKEGYSIEP